MILIAPYISSPSIFRPPVVSPPRIPTIAPPPRPPGPVVAPRSLTLRLPTAPLADRVQFTWQSTLFGGVKPRQPTPVTQPIIPRFLTFTFPAVFPVAVSIPRRGMNTTSLSQLPVTIIAGANGFTGKTLKEAALLRGHRVVLLTTHPKEGIENEYVKQITVSPDTYQNRDVAALAAIIRQEVGEASRVSLINAIGTSIPPEGKTHWDINYTPAVTLQNAMETIADENQSKDFAMVQISSIAASVLGDSHVYSRSRNITDQTLIENAKRCSVTALRPGIIFPKLKDNQVDGGHTYSPSQIAWLPLQPLIPSKAKLQPVYIEDFAKAIFNALEKRESGIVNAVGSEAVTIREMVGTFRTMSNRPLRFVEIPKGFAEVLTRYFPYGRIGPYAVDLLEKMGTEEILFDVEPFQVLLQETPKGFSETLTKEAKGGELILKSPDVVGHIAKIAHRVVTDRVARIALENAIFNHGYQIIKNIFRAIFNSQ